MRRSIAAAARQREQRGEHGQPAHGRYFVSSTSEVLPSPCLNWSLTRPRSGANQLVRVPLPNGNPGCFIVVRTTSALKDPAGTVTFCTPRTVDLPVTP